MTLFKKENIVYTLIAISSCITVVFGHHAGLSQMMKIVLGFCNMYVAWEMVIRNTQDSDEYFGFIHKVCIFLIVYATIELAISLIKAPGHFQTLLFSPFYILTYLLPLFYLLVYDDYFFKKFLILYVFVAVMSLFSLRGYGLTCFFAVIFFPLLIRDRRLIVLFGVIFILDLIFSINLFNFLKDSQRQLAIEITFAIVAIYVVWIKRNVWLAKILSIIFCTIPIIIFVMFLLFRISVFELFSENMNDAIMKLDTRTFLYYEMFSNLKSFGDWLFGFGVGGEYVSQWFGGNRGTTEVTMLHLILKGGLLLALSYVVIIVNAIITGFRYGNNRLVFACCMMLSGHLVCMCVGDYPSRSLLIQIIPFIMVGICCNERILDLTDDEIESIMLESL